jgi:hypothetical protein
MSNVMVTPGVLGVEGKGKAPRWRLTELGYMRDPPTHDFRRWDGHKFKAAKTKSRAGIGARSVQGNRHTNVPENHTAEANSVQEMAHISRQQGVQGNQHRTNLPYAAAQLASRPAAFSPLNKPPAEYGPRAD